MNPALHAAIMASQKSQAAHEGVVERLRKAKAFTASSAILLPDATEAQITQAVGSGVVVRAADGRMHINQVALDDQHSSNGFKACLVLLALASVGASLIALVIRFAS